MRSLLAAFSVIATWNILCPATEAAPEESAAGMRVVLADIQQLPTTLSINQWLRAASEKVEEAFVGKSFALALEAAREEGVAVTTPAGYTRSMVVRSLKVRESDFELGSG